MLRGCGYASGSDCFAFPQPASAFDFARSSRWSRSRIEKALPPPILIELVPGDRSGNRSAFAGAGGVGHDRGRAALVAQPVEEDAALALHLADVGGEALRVGLGDGAREAFGEVGDLVPMRRGVERRDDVHALAAGQHREGLEAQVRGAIREG